jgi:DNA replication protein DnaC
MDAGTVWDSLWEESLRVRVSTTASPSPSGRAPLPLRREARRHWLKDKDRGIDRIEPALRLAIRAAVAGESAWPLVLIGEPGTGKTCSALCLLDHSGGLYFSANGLADKLILAGKGELYNHDAQRRVSATALWEEIAATPLVVLDELGARQAVSDWHYDCVKRTIDEREGRPLIVCSNLGLNAIAGLYDKRVASRLAAGSVLELTGPDRRLPR